MCNVVMYWILMNLNSFLSINKVVIELITRISDGLSMTPRDVRTVYGLILTVIEPRDRTITVL